jgi:flagellar export protein FliJ
MKPFRFRAQSALQLRRREHEHAIAALVRAQSALTAAHHRVIEAAEALDAADAAIHETMRSPTAQAQLEWYRSWKLHWQAERQRREHECREREEHLHHAQQLTATTHQRVRSLERLHDNALTRWQREVEQEERRTMDTLATALFTRRKDSA